jgi:hypothetical protein
MNVQMKVHILITHLLVRMHRWRRVAPGIAAEIAGVNGPLHYIALFMHCYALMLLYIYLLYTDHRLIPANLCN